MFLSLRWSAALIHLRFRTGSESSTQNSNRFTSSLFSAGGDAQPLHAGYWPGSDFSCVSITVLGAIPQVN
jgi:hypothetical protein